MHPSRRLQKTSLPQLVADELMADVERGVIRTGQTLAPESELATQFGVSRAVVREALKSLQALGLVKVVNGVGSIVLPMTSTPLARYFSSATRMGEASLLELLEVRRGIEGEASRLAATRAQPADLVELDRLVELMGDSLTDPVAFSNCDTDFHVSIARASRNQVLVHLVEAIRVPLHRSIQSGFERWMRTGDPGKVHEFHRDVLNAIRSRDPDQATRAMDNHFEQAMRIIRGSPSPKVVDAAAGDGRGPAA